MMKPLMIGVLSLATLAAPMAASAQSWRGDRDRDGRYERWERRMDRQRHRDHRREHWRDRRPAPPHGHAWGHRRWARGVVIPYDYRSRWYVRDYRRYGWAPPPRGYAYYRTDTGDIVLAAIATGVILSLLND